MRTFEEIIKEANNRGLQLANLYQRRTFPANPATPVQDLGWRAEFIHKGGHRDGDVGATACEALEEALARAKNLKGHENRPGTVAIEAVRPIEVSDLI